MWNASSFSCVRNKFVLELKFRLRSKNLKLDEKTLHFKLKQRNIEAEDISHDAYLQAS